MLWQSYWPLLERARLPRIRFNDLRHSAATLLVSLETHPKVAQELPGHRQISLTLDRYSHVTPRVGQKCVANGKTHSLGINPYRHKDQ